MQQLSNNPHKSALPKLLLTDDVDLCLACHTDIKTKMAEGRTHAPAGQDCMSCHQPHFSNMTSLLLKPQQELCAECHETGEQAFRDRHAGIAAEAMNCVNCHNPHASKDPKYFKDVMHAPFAARSCEPCHVAGQ